MKASSLGIALFVAVAVGCNDSGNSTGLASPSDFVGDWLATSWVLTSVANTSQSVDFIALGMALSITFTETTYSGTINMDGGAVDTLSGTYTIDGNQLILDEVGETELDMMTYALSGNTITLTGGDDAYDFDEDGQEDPATFTMALTKQ